MPHLPVANGAVYGIRAESSCCSEILLNRCDVMYQELRKYFYHKSLILMADDERICRMRQEERGDLALNDQCRAFSDAFMNLILATADSLVEAPSHSPLAALI